MFQIFFKFHLPLRITNHIIKISPSANTDIMLENKINKSKKKWNSDMH